MQPGRTRADIQQGLEEEKARLSWGGKRTQYAQPSRASLGPLGLSQFPLPERVAKVLSKRRYRGHEAPAQNDLQNGSVAASLMEPPARVASPGSVFYRCMLCSLAPSTSTVCTPWLCVLSEGEKGCNGRSQLGSDFRGPCSPSLTFHRMKL